MSTDADRFAAMDFENELKEQCPLCLEYKYPTNLQCAICDDCINNAGETLCSDYKLFKAAPKLLASCLALIGRIEEIEQAEGIDTLTAATVHEARIVTLNAQGLTEEGYNA